MLEDEGHHNIKQAAPAFNPQQTEALHVLRANKKTNVVETGSASCDLPLMSNLCGFMHTKFDDTGKEGCQCVNEHHCDQTLY